MNVLKENTDAIARDEELEREVNSKNPDVSVLTRAIKVLKGIAVVGPIISRWLQDPAVQSWIHTHVSTLLS